MNESSLMKLLEMFHPRSSQDPMRRMSSSCHWLDSHLTTFAYQKQILGIIATHKRDKSLKMSAESGLITS